MIIWHISTADQGSHTALVKSQESHQHNESCTELNMVGTQQMEQRSIGLEHVADIYISSFSHPNTKQIYRQCTGYQRACQETWCRGTGCRSKSSEQVSSPMSFSIFFPSPNAFFADMRVLLWILCLFCTNELKQLDGKSVIPNTVRRRKHFLFSIGGFIQHSLRYLLRALAKILTQTLKIN